MPLLKAMPCHAMLTKRSSALVTPLSSKMIQIDLFPGTTMLETYSELVAFAIVTLTL